jgi:AAA domain
MSDDGGGWIAGEEKLGKTWWAMAEAFSLATGETLAGRFRIPEVRCVVFLEEEDSPRRAHRRLRALLRGHGYDPDDPAIRATLDRQFLIEVWGGFSLDSAVMMKRLEITIDAFRPHVVYIDVLRKVTLRALKDEVQMGAILAVLDDLRRRYGVIFRIVHHYRKVQGFRTGRGSQEIGGSFVLGAWAENSIYLEPIGRKQGAVKLSVQCKDLPPTPDFTLRLEFEGPAHDPTTVRLVVAEVPQAPGAAEVDELLIQALATAPTVPAKEGRGGVPIENLIAAVKKSDKTVRDGLRRLIDAGRCLVVGFATKKKKLYGVKHNETT